MPEVEKPDLGHCRHAVQILAMLPETQADARWRKGCVRPYLGCREGRAERLARGRKGHVRHCPEQGQGIGGNLRVQ
jgi:hypothetical protein